MDTPIWLGEKEAAWLRDLLHWFLDRLDKPREKAITRRINERNIPALYSFDENCSYRWHLIQQLEAQFPIWHIKREHVQRHEPEYHEAQIKLRPEAEQVLRAWLNRPAIDPVQAEWSLAIDQHADCFADKGLSLRLNRVSAPGRSATEVVAAFARIAECIHRELTLREISAQCFWGDSKFLDGRIELLNKLLGPASADILPRPLLLIAFAPASFKQIIFVENQDSFLRLVANPPQKSALIYSGGFRASATRLLSKNTLFAYLSGSHPEDFQTRWRDPSLEYFFWGDLDFSGMGILAALRQNIPNIAAWMPGYAPMLKVLIEGNGHLLSQANKEDQKDPGTTGCPYADTVLLPAIRKSHLAVDQEIATPSQAENHQKTEAYTSDRETNITPEVITSLKSS